MNMSWGRFTKKQERGFELVAKAMRKKFPFITFIGIEDIGKYHIWVTIGVEMLEFLKYYNLPPSDFHSSRGVENTRNYYKNFRSSGYLFGTLNHEYLDEFSNEYNRKMETIMNGLYKALPDEYNKLTDTLFTPVPLEIGISGYEISVSESGDFPTPTES
jgi:hypothetical protein